MALFESLVGMLAEFAPILSFFRRSRELFEQMNSTDLEAAIEAVCEEMIRFCLGVVKYCQRKSASERPQASHASLLLTMEANFLGMLFRPRLDVEFKEHNERLKKRIARAEREIALCGVQATQQGLHEVKDLVQGRPGQTQLSRSTKRLIRMIPYCQNGRFFGREAILDRLSEALDPARLPKRQSKFAIYGLAGCGKTQIALAYVYRHYDQYENILWVSSSSVEKIEKDFAEAAFLLGLGKPVMHANEARQFVLQKLAEMNATYLMVFDNVEDISLVQTYWPRTNHGSIIITSRDSVMSQSPFWESAVVPEFTVDEGCTFLRTLLPTSLTRTAEADLKETSTVLGGHPLALSQAATYILSEECQVNAFLKAYHDQRKQPEILTITVSDYELDLSTMWKLSLSTLTPDCHYLLDILTFFDPDSVPYKLLTDGALSLTRGFVHGCETSARSGRLHFLADQDTFKGLLRTLRKQSLIRTNFRSSSFTIHRLVQEYASQRLGSNRDRERKVFADALSLLGSMQPKDDCTRHWSPHLWDTALVYFPHVRALESRFREKPAAFWGFENSLARLLFNCANSMFERNRYNIGLEIIASARTTAEAAESPDYKLLSDLHRLEGRLCNEANLPQQGLDAFQAAFRLAKLAVHVGQLEPDDTRCVRTKTGWGNCLNQLGRFDEALNLQLEASQACATDPERHGDAQSIVMLNLGYVYFRRGNLEEAEATFRQAQQLDAKFKPVLYALGNLAILRGQLDCALKLHLEALQLYVDEFGEQHQCVADSLFKVGETYLKMNLLSDAVTHLHKSLAMYRSEGQHFDARAAISRGARMLAIALQRLSPEQARAIPEQNVPPAGALLKEAYDLHEELTGKVGSTTDTDDDYSSLMFYWSR